VWAAAAVSAALLRTWAAAYLQSEVVHDSRLHAERLVADGPYRHVRNPLYLGGILMAIGFGLLASRVGSLVIVIGLTIFYYRLIRREEIALLETQRESYRAYLAEVPCVIPSLTPRLPSSGKEPRWGQAFLGELFLWLFAVSITVFAITLRATVLYVAIGAAVVARAATLTMIQRNKRREESLTAPPAP